ncbi:MAG: hypothetical protein CM15mP49_25270 [Actinomycetota bacterium]|nr:MAG: hypothetical protein CM15mP49_25270 [Actinomycetota bacterium]
MTQHTQEFLGVREFKQVLALLHFRQRRRFAFDQELDQILIKEFGSGDLETPHSVVGFVLAKNKESSYEIDSAVSIRDWFMGRFPTENLIGL